MLQVPHFCIVLVLRQSPRFKEHHSGRLMHLYIFTLFINNSWDTETNPGPDPLFTIHISLVDWVKSVLAALRLNYSDGYTTLNVHEIWLRLLLGEHLLYIRAKMTSFVNNLD